jgi:DNA-directed RNA polymerase subunit K/omega
MERFTLDQLLKLRPNKYEALVIAGRRAREIAQKIRTGEIPEHVKPTIRALEELLGEIEGEPVEEEEAAPDDEDTANEEVNQKSK